MLPHRFAFGLAVVMLTSARADALSDPPVVIHGTATTASGRPLAGATLFLLELPGSPGVPPGVEAQEEVVTDAAGRFAWTVPTDIRRRILTDVPKDSTAPACYALPPSSGEKADVALASNWQGANADTGRRDLWEKATRRCETHWTQTGKDAQILVVAPDTGEITLTVRGPGGQPLPNRTVQVVASGLFTDYEGAVVYSSVTDAAGRLFLRRYPSLLHLLVSVPGVGFGATGTFEVLTNKEAAPALPPLAPFAQVSGTVAPGLVKPGAFVHLEDYMAQEHTWYDPRAEVNAQCRFRLGGVLPGQHHLVLVGGQSAAGVDVTVSPGEAVTGIALKPKPAAPANAGVFPFGPAQTTKLSVRGHLTDMAGRPVAGADIYALCSYQGAIRRYQEVRETRTGADGAYFIPDLPVGEGWPDVSLVALMAGSPAAAATAAPAAAHAGRQADLQADLTLPDTHTALTVRILQHGLPLAGASVRLTPQEGMSLFDPFYVGAARGPARDRVAACLMPSGTTDAAGEVRFRDLAPGLWDVSAVAGPLASLDTVGRWNGGQPPAAPFGTAQGVAVEAGAARRFALSIFPQPGEVALQVRAPDGRPPTDPTIAFQFGPAAASSGGSTSLTLDKDGVGRYSLTSPGLWRLVTRFRDTALDSFPANTEPFYEGSALIAVSPALPTAPPVLIRTVRRGPGRLRVRLLDRAGRPAAGSVSIGDPFDPAKYALSVGAGGEGVFSQMPSGSYLLKASFVRALLPPALGKERQAFPSDAALTGVSLLVPQAAVVKSDTETLVTFRPQPQGYVRGRVLVPGSPADYAVYLAGYSETPPVFHYDKGTGEFVAGPFPAGKTTLRVERIIPQSSDWEASGKNFPIVVPAGEVLHTALSMDLPAAHPPGSGTETVLTMGGVFSSDRRPLTGQVFLSDGVTPAWGARAALVVPETVPPVRMARADALGRLTAADYWYSAETPSVLPPGSPAGPVVVAWLPGAAGAVIVPVTDVLPARLVLPPPLSVSGRVTVGGASAAGLPSSFRILAAYQGRGTLNPLLSVEATAQADGTFTLAGLTPGTYQVQAARDSVWLSASQTLTVGDAGALPPLHFDIAPPGNPVVLHLTDRAGKPLPGRTVTLDRPAGPLTGLLWPPTAAADPHGDLRLDGLEAGPHTVDGTAAFTVPPLAGAPVRAAGTQTVVLTGPETVEKPAP